MCQVEGGECCSLYGTFKQEVETAASKIPLN